jgi:ParB family chromosome partitioning protein
MSKKKKFVISQSLHQGLSDTMNAVKNNAGSVRFEVITLSRIETDPENPRELKVSHEEVKRGIEKGAPFYEDKRQELENLRPLSETIQKKGLINPVVVYKHGEKYRLVAGERRFLASILAGKEDIQARILNEKPNSLDLRLLQWIENTEREDLSLKDRLGNVKSILNEYKRENVGRPVSASLIKELIGISLPQATCYLSVLNASKDVEEQIILGNINNLDKAAFIAKIEEKDLRQKAIESCIKGDSLKVLRQLVDTQVKQEVPVMLKVPKKPGRVATKVSLGATNKPSVIKKIITSVLDHPQFKHIEPAFKEVDWNEYTEVSRAFRKFLTILEKEVIEDK